MIIQTVHDIWLATLRVYNGLIPAAGKITLSIKMHLLPGAGSGLLIFFIFLVLKVFAHEFVSKDNGKPVIII